MTDIQFLETANGRRIAYVKTDGQGPTILFLSGLKSDMEGTKAVALEAWAKAEGRAFMRFDYSGHGQSSEEFTDGCIGDWHEDTLAVVDQLIDGPVLAVGSSMGGWQSLLLARARPGRLVGLVTIAAAPDFTEDGYWTGFNDDQKAELEREGFLSIPSDYDEDYVITKLLIEDGRDHLVLRSPLPLNMPVRFLQGTEDTAVSTAQALKLLEHVDGNDIRLTLVKGADHRFSDDECLRTIQKMVKVVLARI
ncbi:Pimeloyl-ACP methyl ester carboxylesterase [Aliiroseovarius sediminilitoris]|uniref:Palmitoyl-protein thioesterase ABHD10, mitochondrial n=1 Tax=Aliiroseovarius sediminilitoris TaxID=1173584 RepID=A0A1I0Q622_9RHOB|nr:alpha/beta hydrolase [Aliiroseovarius sediminilitoris]SEW22427.1 Pimeloyl-ACP methyl ester carboxylesterase [Aliiroseovarius sediminilitoris]